MFRGKYQKGCFSVFYSIGSDPLSDWGVKHKNGYCKRVYDEDIKSIVLELMGDNVSTMFIEIPRNPRMSMGIKLPFLVMLIKNMAKYFTFEVKIMDDQNFFRRFRISNFQNSTSIKTFCTCMPMGMSPGWNQIHFNLADFTRRAYGTSYMETVHMQVHANIRIRRIYFTDRLYTDDELPNEFRLQAKPKERQRQKDFKVPAARPPSPAKSEKTNKANATEEEGDAATSVAEPPTQATEDGTLPAATSMRSMRSMHSVTVTEAPVVEDETANVEEPKPAEEQFYFY